MTRLARTRPVEKNSNLYKYWMQRYNLFSRFDDGILLDDESWWSVTPENIAIHIAKRFQESFGFEGHYLVVDGFCGVGGNLIQFACSSPHVRVIGCDINIDKLRMARNNSRIYGVEHQCDFILGDFMDILQSLSCQRVNAVFLSPPWGGVDYGKHAKYSLSSMTPNGYDVIKLCRKYITDNIAILLPRNVDLKEIRKELLDKKHPLFECEQNMVGSKVKTITAYFGDLVDHSQETDSECDS